MYPDAFTIESLASELNQQLKGTILKDIFSTSKTDLFFVFSEKKGFKVQFFQGQAFFQFPGIEQFPLKNRMEQFASSHSHEVTSVNVHPNSRSFDIELCNKQKIVFKIFGKFSNVILFDENPLEIFCLNHQKDLQKPLSTYIDNVTISSTPINSAPIHIVKQPGDRFELSFQKENSIGSYLNIMDAFNDFTRLFIGAESFKTKKQSQVLNLEKQLNQKQKLQNELIKSMETIKQKRSWAEIGDLVMANLHSIHTGITKVEVLDFYNNSKTFIKLKADLNPQQNAALFYKKAKNEVKEIEFKQKSLEAVTLQIETLNRQLEKLKEADDPKKLRSLDRFNSDMLAKANSNRNNDPLAKANGNRFLPYRVYKIGEFDVYVGKNSKANDEMLSKYSSKNDTWLHAKDVSGSHVLIKNPGSKPIPNPVLEQAAALAAWYSKAKNNKLASVIYTLRKYVRKPKGAPAGQVIVEREKGILVVPKDMVDN